jgi:hypothetical protein
MTFPSHGHLAPISAVSARSTAHERGFEPDTPARRVEPLELLDQDGEARPGDPGTVILTCASCGAEMIERKCKLICRCGYFLSCSDYY